MPTLFLQPSIYSLSTPELTLETPVPPRPYEPLIASPSPSPSPSRESTPSPPSLRQYNEGLLPLPSQTLQAVTQHIRTVSLDKAKAALRSPGAQHLLPEEMRVLAAAKKSNQQHIMRSSRSFEGLVPLKSPVLYPVQPSPILPSPTPLDWPLQATTFSDKHESKLSDEYFGMSKAKRMSMSPVERQLRSSIEISITRPSEPRATDYESRGRSRQQSRTGSSKRLNGYESKMIDAYDDTSLDASSNESLIDEARRLANEYHDLFKEDVKSPALRKNSASPNSIKEKMKLVPQPLFFNPRKISKQRELQYQKERSQQRFPPAPRKSSNSSRSAPSEPKGSPKTRDRALNFPYKLSLTPGSTNAKRRRSTSGTIPISPPFPGMSEHVPGLAKSKALPTPVQRKNSIDDSNRFSAFYQRINADAQQLAREYNKPGSKVALEMNTLPSILSRPSIDTFASSSHASSHYGRSLKDGRASQDSGVSSGASSRDRRAAAPPKPFLHKGFAASVTSKFSHHVRKSSVTAAEGFSHLVDSFKTQRRPSFPVISAPMPIPIDDSSRLQVGDSAGSKKRPSIFTSISDHRREIKASKRREELKRTIKVVPGELSQVPREDGGWL
jgi:hypothetical protein